MNYFAHQSAAKRYANARPYFHPLVMQKIKEFLSLRQPFSKALDVGCGTGQSTIALKDIANEIIGMDNSQDMLNEAQPDSRIHYLCTPAEQLPFLDASFDLITVSSAFHWLDRPRFLAEAARVLNATGWLILYSNGFTGEMVDNPAFEDWNWNTYIPHYPIPPRNNQPLTDIEAKQYGLHLIRKESYLNEVVFTPETLANYLMTQSNVIASVEQGKEQVEDVHEWLISEVTPLFQGTNGIFRFGGTIEYLQKELYKSD